MRLGRNRKQALALAAIAGCGALALAPNPIRARTVSGVENIDRMLMTPWVSPAALGEGGPATDLLLCYPMGLAVDSTGRLLISDRGGTWRGRMVWSVDETGVAHALAGTGRKGTNATKLSYRRKSFYMPEGLAVSPDGRIYIADALAHAVFRVDDDRLTRVAGTGIRGYSGDGGPAVEAQFDRPTELRFDRRGNLYVLDVRNHRVRRVDADGRVSTVVGTGEPGFTPDGTPALQARLNTPWGMAIDAEDRLLIADSGNGRIRRVEHDGMVVTIAGNGERGYGGDGGPAVHASFDSPEALSLDDDGRIYVSDEHNNAVRRIDLDGRISTVVGTGRPGSALYRDSASKSELNDPEGILVHPDGSLVIADGLNGRVIRVTTSGKVEHVAGSGDVEKCEGRW